MPHTPGKWTIIQQSPSLILIVAEDHGTVCEIRDANEDALDEQALPDAHLIAATPRLLQAALDTAKKAAEILHECNDVLPEDYKGYLVSMIDELSEVIGEATHT